MDTIINGIIISSYEDSVKERLITTVLSKITIATDLKSLVISLIDNNILQYDNDLNKCRWSLFIVNHCLNNSNNNNNSNSNSNNEIINHLYMDMERFELFFALILSDHQTITTYLLEQITILLRHVMLSSYHTSDNQFNLDILKSYLQTVFITFESKLSLSILRSLLAMLSCLTEQARDATGASTQSIVVSSSLADILNHSPVDLIVLYVPLLIENKSISDQHLYLIIRSLITLPVTPTNSAWILETLNTMKTVKKNRLLVSLTIECSPILLKQMFQGPLLLESAYDVMENMLLGYQHSPDAFHQITSLLPAIIEFILLLIEKKKKLVLQHQQQQQQQQQQVFNVTPPQSSSKIINFKVHKVVKDLTAMNDRKQLLLYAVKNCNDSYSNWWLLMESHDRLQSLLTRVTKMSWILMNHYSGYPELYSPLTDRLQRLGQPYNQPPKEFECKMILKTNEWKGMQSMHYENTKLGRTLSDRSGLYNLGNTCFMNSFLQSLYMTIPFRDYFLSEMDSPNLTQESIDLVMKRGNMVKQLQLLFGYLRYSVRSAFSPSKFLSTLSFEYQTGEQHDTYEFGKYLLDSLDSMLKFEMKSNHYLQQKHNISTTTTTQQPESKGESTTSTTTIATTSTTANATTINNNTTTVVTDMFGGKIEQSIKCLKCNNESISKEELFELSLAFPPEQQQQNQTTINDCVELDQLIRYFFSVELLNANNRYHCSKCESLQDAERKLQISGSPPKHLILSLKRFAYNIQSKSISKIFTIVDYPETLHIPSDYVNLATNTNANTNDNTQQKQQQQEFKYQLYAIIFHSGTSVNYGHYFTYAKPSLSSEDDWCLLNDSNVQLIDLKSIKDVPKKFQKDTPYILFYRLAEATKNNSNNNNENMNFEKPTVTPADIQETTQQQTETQTTTTNIPKPLHDEEMNVAPWIASEVKRDNKSLSESSSSTKATSVLESIK
ncbi:peptidase C19 family protein [Heterostelium album PN500]|uniref:Ubiquitin carboxyl-terminal hydrolase n=1 Tax=Heterostelium pallidum (strain ATCC 26659 / Pp 5 / PN500) TaxID=670386 RepID=D3B101_HETP5|nr:peptidase C19 family protein [Heterostelium album PN500]EFA84975.1 peptidase C19 family protein [Heterostelium album PN500]|eukprot:XP_020437085.1 peptidase C19 family protein [Heterostelium album PN500]